MKTYELKEGEVADCSADGEFLVKFENGKVVLIPKTRCWLIEIREATKEDV